MFDRTTPNNMEMCCNQVWLVMVQVISLAKRSPARKEGPTQVVPRDYVYKRGSVCSNLVGIEAYILHYGNLITGRKNIKKIICMFFMTISKYPILHTEYDMRA